MNIFLSIFKILFLITYISALQNDYECSNEKLFDVPLTFNLINQHFYSKYSIRKINETCIKGEFCLNYLVNRGLHETMRELSKVWIDPRLRDEICSDSIKSCIKDLERNSTYIIQDFLTPIAHTLMCHVAFESNSDECILSSLELLQYSFWHIEKEINGLFGLTGQCNDNMKINLTACENLRERLFCLKTYCSENGIIHFLKTVYPNFFIGNNSDVSKCSYLGTKLMGDKIILNFINKVSVKSAVIGLCVLVSLCIIAVFIAFYFTGRLNAAQFYNARQYIRLKQKENTEIVNSTDEKEDDSNAETIQLLPDNKT